MTTVGVRIPYVPECWASHVAMTQLFEYHHLAVVKETRFERSPDGCGICAEVRFSWWYDTQWSRYIRTALSGNDKPVYVALPNEERFLTLRPICYDEGIDDVKRQLSELRRAMGLQCTTCTNERDLEEDDDDFGKYYCPSCWFTRNNAEAIRAKEREIDELRREIHRGQCLPYEVEERLEHIQERWDEIAMLRNA